MSVALQFSASDADAYEAHMGRHSRGLAELFLDFVGTAEGEQVLDLGCGTGSLTFTLAHRVDLQGICGVDVAEPYIEFARERSNEDPRIEFRQGSATNVPMGNNSVDKALSILLLSFVSDTQAALSEMIRVTRPGGTVAAALWDTRGGHVVNRMFWDTAAAVFPDAMEARKGNYTRPMSRPGELANAFHVAGLADIEEATLGTRMEFSSFDDFWTPETGKQGPFSDYLETLDQQSFETLREYIRAAYLDGEEDGPRSYAAVAWAVKGTVPEA